jgi:hypothetical protein
LLVTQGHALLLAIEAQHHDIDVVADLEVLARVSHPTPGDVRDVEQTVEAAEIHEHAVVGDVLDRTGDELALVQVGHGLLFGLPDLFFENRLARQHDVGAPTVERDDPGLDLLTDVVLKAAVGAHVHQRTGQEGADADVHRQTALDPFQHHAGDRLFSLERLLDVFPDLELRGTVAGQPNPAFAFVQAFDQHFDLVADLHFHFSGLTVGELGQRDRASHL